MKCLEDLINQKINRKNLRLIFCVGIDIVKFGEISVSLVKVFCKAVIQLPLSSACLFCSRHGILGPTASPFSTKSLVAPKFD